MFSLEELDNTYFFEKDRIASFKLWPFDDKSPCSISKMAEAGFYWCGNDRENDTTTCFTCGKILDGWEATDDPWVEHKQHAPQCHFLKLGKPESQITFGEMIDLLGNIKLARARENLEIIRKEMVQDMEKTRNEFIKSFESK